ncbi:hypothetical protein HY450_00125 [Candidatus Pacearchaeota archaeon]|nr:hypothetical protein [Candidatus Pacearchaeota archaeon]
MALEEFVKGIDEAQKVQKLEGTRKDYRSDKKEKSEKVYKDAQDELRQYAYEVATSRFEGYKKKAEEMTPEEVQKFYQLGQAEASEKAQIYFYENLDELLDKELPESALEILAGAEDVVKSADDKDRKILQKYLALKGIEEMTENYEKTGKPRNEEEAEAILKAGIRGYAEAQKEKLKNMGYNEEIQALGLQLAALAIQSGSISEDVVKKYAIAGLKSQIGEVKKEEDEKENYKFAVRNTIKRMARSDKREDFAKAINLVYSAHDAYRKSDAYKKAA